MKDKSKVKVGQVEILPAAVNSLSLNEYVAVKYGAPKGQKPFTAERKHGINYMYLPDRTIYCGRGNSVNLGLMVEDADSFFALSPLSNPAMLKAIGYNYMMVTPDQLATSEYVRRNGLVKVFSDSGGFQLSRGVTAFIEPDELAEFYKNKIDYGIGLDIPIPLHLQRTDWFLRMCRVTIKNNQYIADKLKGSKAQLYDVSHGLTLNNRKRFLKHVLDNKVGVGLSLGGIGQANYDTAHTSTLMAVINLCYTLDASKGMYDRYHVLGTTSLFMVSIYNMLTRLGVAPLITADSSTYTQGALAFNARGIKYTGTANIATYVLDHQPISWGLPCNCPICALAGYPAVYRMSHGGNAIHSMWVLRKNFELVAEHVNLYLDGQVSQTDLLKLVSTHPSAYPLYRSLYAFVQDMDKGFDKAWAIHKHKFESSMRKENGKQGLFSSTVQQKLPEQLVRAEANVTQAIERYEKFHNLGPLKGKSK